jgi:hypothetical protein
MALIEMKGTLLGLLEKAMLLRVTVPPTPKALAFGAQ